MLHRSFATAVALAILFVAVGCTRESRGGSCKFDKDCEKGLECLQGSPGDPGFCSSKCTLDVPGSCPEGWKCVNLDHFTGLNACARK